MSQLLPVPAMATITLAQLLKSLSDPTRLAIVTRLADQAAPVSCVLFENLGKKSNLSQHYRNLRLNGLITISKAGRHSYLQLRRQELDAYFPDLIGTIVAANHR
ncbi:hypothetical protein FC83_GL001911 [Agrilactobacillus composti DSM 18527 = JCM 14202]|uniref:HTH arsR-type domain-containing protein n=1 Tax=Agrilactobacillus composti DSM 18527 = JCM 14202 TaxID=1423734 RepID=X0PGL1_9LACO|nr:helix-turn-helix transcriptional regulator [Agrilactobacillus composti]KRM34975.1 hypothetical protein FC83_GL001911 [Agrilactobacillus composti DSM 18527 = JCM 14202]GAF41048.1 transcriptional regulator, ArsR family [Agrilactobacillus composti DSM 18527 = JCM 14202]